MDMIDPYKILGVTKNASQDEIKNAYRNLAKKYHPDLNPGNKEFETKFKSLSAAYELIGSAEMRGKYDRGETPEQMEAAAREYASRSRQGPNYYDTQQSQDARYSSQFAGMGAEDFFENLFRQSGARTGGRHTDFPGEDALYHMDVDFRDAARGADKEINLPNGKKLQIKIPAGVETGTRLRFRGQGSSGIGKGPAGDAYVEIRVKPLAGFIRNGNDIETEVPISFIEAILGAEIPVNTLDGNVSLKVPPGVSTGSRLRIRGKGITNKIPGDQIVKLKVVMPKKIDANLEAEIKSWDGKYSYNPRSEQ